MYKTKRFIGVRRNNRVFTKEFKKTIRMTYGPRELLDNYEISFHIEVDEHNACKKIWFGLKSMKYNRNCL
ncbi:g011 [Yersinia phage phiR1-37]|uniref:hypothetical protein n=1 Tax=Yersinia phage phiR1-37 TaxID=331278 RepID=UPI00022DBCB7|nr:hypothetical protein phiR1-37_gp011 [Yersinia phage phiR1-37]CCE26035.1 g011 [Yersinia phage phiR1-37]